MTAKPKPDGDVATPKRVRPRWLKSLIIIGLALLLLPVLEVGCVRFVNPPGTPLMVLRQAEARFKHLPAKPGQYSWVGQLPPDFLQAVLLSEDQRFFRHHGFDWKEVALAQSQALRKNKPARGASTITMQCARSLFLWQGRSWVRKALEAYYTFWMELLLPKNRILTLYANVIEMGDRVYGVEAAARFHFDQPAAALTRDQCAMLAALLPNPRKADVKHPSPELRRRQQHILKLLGTAPPNPALAAFQ